MNTPRIESIFFVQSNISVVKLSIILIIFCREARAYKTKETSLFAQKKIDSNDFHSSFIYNSKGSVIFNFEISFKKEDSTNGETLTKDLEETGLGNHSVSVNDIENNNCK